MAKAFYLKLAAGNLRRNRRMYAPFFVAAAVMSGMYFIIVNMIFSLGISNMPSGPTAQSLLTVGIGVMSFFIVGYMLYINSFLIKRRKKEFGLYGVLGLEKRHVGRMIFHENLMLTCAALAAGIAFGCVFGKLCFMMLMKAIHTAPDSRFEFTIGSFIAVIAMFGFIFVLTTLYNLMQVRLASPIDLLRGEKMGEKKVRFVLPMTVLGVLGMGAAYFVAITVKQPAFALIFFWPAVIVVIIATYMLFISGSAFVLGRMKKRKRFYYKSKNFIAVSGLMHRMKQNASGLANICILSTMVLVTMSACCSLYFGQESILNQTVPSDISVSVSGSKSNMARDTVLQLNQEAMSLSSAYGVTITRQIVYENRQIWAGAYDGELLLERETAGVNRMPGYEDSVLVCVIPFDDYSTATGDEDTQLLADEVLLLCGRDIYREKDFDLPGGKWVLRGVLKDTVFTKTARSEEKRRAFLVARDREAADALYLALCEGYLTPDMDMNANLAMDISGSEENCLAYAQELRTLLEEYCAENAQGNNYGYSVSDAFSSRQDGYGIYGGLIFLGTFLSLLFILNTVLIIYFKQVSEGMEDADRFRVMQMVGMSDVEVRLTINRQILIVFFLPLLAALIHVAAASNMISKILGVFLLYDPMITNLCILITAAAFTLVYIVVYRVTARIYYQLVKW